MMAEVLIDFKYMQRVPALIESAEACVRVAMFQLQVHGKKAKGTSRELALKLVAKAMEGKDVRVLLNVAPGKAKVAAYNRGAATWLQARKVQVRCIAPTRICHAKLVIVDAKLAVIGSHNWGVGSMTGNFEVSVVIRDAAAVGRLVEYFDTLWPICHRIGR